jgi:hypothetical protein
MAPHALRGPSCTLRAAPRRAAPLRRACTPAAPQQQQRHSRAAAMSRASVRAAASSSPITDLYALDFDGVVCDSVGESAQAAWLVRSPACPLRSRPVVEQLLTAHPHARTPAQAAEKLWPDVFATPAAAAQRGRVLEEMRRVRPVIETGYENVVQARLLLEAAPGTRPEDMLAHWGCVVGGRGLPAASARACARVAGRSSFVRSLITDTARAVCVRALAARCFQSTWPSGS